MVLGDVPVDLHQPLFVKFSRGARAAEGAAVRSAGVLGESGLNGGEKRRIRDETRERGRQVLDEFFPINKEEQVILPDRATEGKAIGALLKGRPAVDVRTKAIRSLPVLVGKKIIDAAVEFVGAALADRVNGGAGETALADVIGRERNAELLDGVDRKGIEGREQAREGLRPN